MKKYIITILIISGALVVSLSVPKTYQIKNVSQEPEGTPVITPVKTITAKITQYTLLGIMASGKQVYDGAIANNQYPIGTIVRINGIEYKLEDRMAKRFSERWDIWQQDEFTAWQWGIRELPIEIIYIPKK